MDESINVSDIIAILEIEENDFTSKKYIRYNTHINNYNINIQYFIILSSLIHNQIRYNRLYSRIRMLLWSNNYKNIKGIRIHNSNKSYMFMINLKDKTIRKR